MNLGLDLHSSPLFALLVCVYCTYQMYLIFMFSLREAEALYLSLH